MAIDSYTELYLTLRHGLMARHPVPLPPADTLPAGGLNLNDYATGTRDGLATGDAPGHFLDNGRYPINLFQGDAWLYRTVPGADPPHGTMGFGDNPLLDTGKLLIPLAIEASLGNTNARDLVAAAVRSIGTLFYFGGPFAGYPLRRDPVSSYEWGPGYLFARNFLLDEGGYLYATPTHDWRAVRRFDQASIRALPPAARMNWLRDYWDYDKQVGDWEPSSDEFAGLICGLFFVTQMVSGQPATDAASLLGRIAEYLAEHSYFLVRPNGGFTRRGPAVGSVASEWAYQRVFARITGDPHPARHPTEAVLAQAGLWPVIQADWNALGVAGMALNVLLDLVPGLAAAVNITADLLLQTLEGVPGVMIGQAAALATDELAFDCEVGWDEGKQQYKNDYPTEIALAHLLRAFDPATRFRLYVGRWAANQPPFAGPSAQAWSLGFTPFHALSSLGDTDRTVRDEYLFMFRARRKGFQPGVPGGFPDWRSIDGPHQLPHRLAFETAAALLVAADNRDPAVPDLEHELIAALDNARAGFTSSWHGNIPVYPAPREDGRLSLLEDGMPALDFNAALALAWLHRLRQQSRNQPVSPGLPALPTAAELAADSFTARPKPPVPPPVLPDPSRLGPPTVRRASISPNHQPQYVGISLSPYDQLEIVASGQVNPGFLFPQYFGPDGAGDTPDSIKYPMFGADARKYALIGRLDVVPTPGAAPHPVGQYFTVGSHFGPRRYLYDPRPSTIDPAAQPVHSLCLAVNTDDWNKGNGQFDVTIRHWPALAPRIDSLTASATTSSDGNAVSITGAGFRDTLAVFFGETSAQFTIDSDSHLTAVAPASLDDAVEVTVLSLIGRSNPVSYSSPTLRQVWHNEQTTAGMGAPWTGWSVLSEVGNKAKSVAVAAHPDGRMHAVMIGLDAQLWHNEQTAAGVSAGWTGWHELSGAGDKGTALAVAAHPDGRLHAVMAGLDAQLWHNEQTAAGVSAGWTGWHELSGAGDKGTAVALAAHPDGRMHAVMAGLDGQLWHNEQTTEGMGTPWTGWSVLSEVGSKAKSVAVGTHPDGRLHAVMIGV